ncbi:MAG: hypothetical protein ACI94Y_002826, partial [Maribacter sp.]
PLIYVNFFLRIVIIGYCSYKAKKIKRNQKKLAILNFIYLPQALDNL